ncbi:MAG: hypothetical protein PHS96_03455 [Anaerolineales bacterium]|nr:hypothetical protein [Anaerolineales bacterium]
MRVKVLVAVGGSVAVALGGSVAVPVGVGSGARLAQPLNKSASAEIINQLPLTTLVPDNRRFSSTFLMASSP